MENRTKLKKKLENLLSNKFNPELFVDFVKELTKNLELSKDYPEIPLIENYKIEPFAIFKDKNNKNLHILFIKANEPSKIEKAYREHREVIKKYINANLYSLPNGILAVFYNDNYPKWRLSYTEIDWDNKGQLKTPPKRYTYLVGEGEPIHTPAEQLLKLIENPPKSIEEIKEAFSVEPLTKEFFQKYRNLYLKLKKHLEDNKANERLKEDLHQRGYSIDDFAKKLLGQLVFLYFLQKKGWLGVPKDKQFGEGNKKFLRMLFNKAEDNNENYYLNYLVPLFYETLNNPRENQPDPNWSEIFQSKIPFLNGGLFEAIYNYKNIAVYIDNEIFSNKNNDGILDIFDTYNFTAKEDEPLEKEVAVDPEMLGKVFENLIAENERKGLGTFYTPREIVNYMSQQSIIYYLADKLNLPTEDIRQIFVAEDFNELPETIKEKAEEINNELANLKIVDPACGSGAFLVGVLQEIVKARSLLNNKTMDIYELKKEAIENSIYGVDIDIGATEIAKLRLWLSLIVDETNPNKIEPLPNLEYKIMCGNSLLEELIIGDEVIPLSIEFDKSLNDKIKNLKKEIWNKKEKLYQFLVNEKRTKNDKEVKKLEKEIKSLENKLKNSTTKNINGTLTGIATANQIFEEIKKLQHKFFNEHNPEEKKRLKEKIDKKIKEFVLEKIKEKEEFLERKIKEIQNKYINTQMPKREEKKLEKYAQILTELENYKEKLNFRGCNKNFFLWHLNFSEVFMEKDGFDIVIANPPYGVRVNIFNKDKYSHYDKQKNSASFFLELAAQIGNEESIFSYIIPKSLTYSEGWNKTRKLILDKNKLNVIIDVSQAFEKVKLEQVILIYQAKNELKDYKFLTGNNWNSKIKITGSATKSLAELLNIIPIYINKEKLLILKKLLKDSIFLDKISETSRGLPYQKKIRKDGSFPVLRGKNIQKYAIKGILDKVYLTNEDLKKKKVKEILKPKIVSQNIVAHIMKPYDRIMIMATFDKNGLLTLDTVMNTFITNKDFSYQYILALLNSKLMEWYFYWFVYNRAIRTMHFDKYYMGKLPVKNIPLEQQKPFIELVDKILELTNKENYENNPDLQRKVKEYSDQIDKLVYKLYNLTEEEIKFLEKGEL